MVEIGVISKNNSDRNIVNNHHCVEAGYDCGCCGIQDERGNSFQMIVGREGS